MPEPKVGEPDSRKLILFMYGLVKIFGGLARDMATLEAETGLKSDVLTKLNDPNALAGFLSRIPDEQAGRFIKFIMDVSPILTRGGDILTASSEDKELFSQNIENVLKRYRSLIQEAEGGKP